MLTDLEDSGIKIGKIHHLSPREAFEAAKKGAVFVDVRHAYETCYKGFGVEEVIYIDHEEIKERYTGLPQDKFLVIADSVGLHSKEVIEFLQQVGFTHLANLNGGIFDWERDGLPLKTNKKEKLTGSCACMLKPHGKRK
ncbi:MAG: hypothetical protein IH597_08655 [Bacteroidales bacterium]|nr:hypothetical protein [Bacteroidales bacterium]